MFGKTATSDAGKGQGYWNAKFFGPAADTDDPDVVANTVPSGVAGDFQVDSKYTKIVGAFAAEN